MAFPLLSDVRRIAVLRANGIGDLVLALPALDALRAAYPDADITLLGRPWHPELFGAGRPGPVDRVEVVPPAPGLHADGPEDPDATRCFQERMRDRRLDLAVQLHGGGANSNPWVAALGARTTIGLRALDAPALDRTVPYVYWQHEVLRYLEVVALAGAPPVGLEPRLGLLEADLTASRAAIDDSAPFILLAPGATDARRWWPAESFAAVGDALHADGLRVGVVGATHERELCEAVASSMRAPADVVAGHLDLPGLAGLLHRARLVVANDSGPLHLAGAVGAATVGIYWCGILPAAGPLTMARHRPLVSWRMRCPVCGREGVEMACEHRVSFVADVTVEDVLEQARDLLG